MCQQSRGILRINIQFIRMTYIYTKHRQLNQIDEHETEIELELEIETEI